VHYVGRVDWQVVATPAPPSATATGLARRVVVGPEQGATHTELAIGAMAPGGWINRHVHSFEEALYVIDGSVLLEIDRHVHRLVAGDFGFIPIATPHTLVTEVDSGVRWLGLNTPPRRPPDAPVPDTVFATRAPDVAALAAAARRLSAPDPFRRLVGHYEGTPPQAEALAIKEPARGRGPAGMDTAILAYNGISVKMLVDRTLGADLLTMFTVDYELGAGVPAHDHPFEEAYVFLAGEVEAEVDGEPLHLTPGDVLFAGVGTTHGFWNEGTERVRWIETQAPQPPTRHSYRWQPDWERVARLGVEP
jgi:quercetin dioxygenase-like cupin family protein